MTFLLLHNDMDLIEKLEFIEKLKLKIKKLRVYMSEEQKELEIEIVFAGDVINYFKGDCSDFYDVKLVDVALCNNALNAYDMKAIYDKNICIRTLKAGIREIIGKIFHQWPRQKDGGLFCLLKSF